MVNCEAPRDNLSIRLHEAIVAAIVGIFLITSLPAHAQVMPPTMTICEDARCDEGNGATSWTFQGQQGQEQSGGQVRALLLERIDAGGVVIRRQDTSAAAIGSEPYTLFIGHVYGDFAIGTMNRHAGGQIVSAGTWRGSTAPTICGSSISVAQAKSIGARAAGMKQNKAALDCYLIAARQGDPEAQTMSGLLLHSGLGIIHDQAAALNWLKKAAALNDYDGEVALAAMYQQGAGTAPDATKATFWINKAQQQKAAAEAAKAKRDTLELLVVSTFVAAILIEGSGGNSSASGNAPGSFESIRTMK